MSAGNSRSRHWLFRLLLGNIAASLFHYLHNMIYFAAYPNEPGWLSPGRIDIAWLVITPLGLFGYLFYRRRGTGWSFALLYLYGLLGLGVLGHYLLAPVAAHTPAMNLSILLEAAAALALLGYLTVLLVGRRRDLRMTAGDSGL